MFAPFMSKEYDENAHDLDPKCGLFKLSILFLLLGVLLVLMAVVLLFL